MYKFGKKHIYIEVNLDELTKSPDNNKIEEISKLQHSLSKSINKTNVSLDYQNSTNSSNNSPATTNFQDSFIEEPHTKHVLSKSNSSPSKSNENSSDEMY